jgi:hypothetical protein
LGFALSGFIYLPVFLERHYLRFDELISYYNDHFVAPWQLVRSHWGYGFSHPGTLNDDMSFQIGLTHILVVILSLLALTGSVIYRLVFNGKKPNRITKALNKLPIIDWIKTGENNFLIGWWLIAFVIAVFLMLELPIVHTLWKTVPFLATVDFPWRFLGVTVFAASMLAVYLTQKIKSSWIVVLPLIFLVFYANRNHTRINQSVHFDDQYFENYPATATWRNEFLPKTRLTNRWNGIGGNYHFDGPSALVTPQVQTTNRLLLDTQITEPTKLVIHRMYFPGWNLTINNHPAAFNTDQFQVTPADVDIKTQIDYSGFISSQLTPGQYRLDLQFKPTSVRRTGQILSLAALLLTAFLICYPDKKPHVKTKH